MMRKSYSNEFKTEAVRLAERGDVSKAQVARDLEVPYELLRTWVKTFGAQPDGLPGPTPDERAELIRLRREMKIVKEERDILKKALGIFTRELP